ncbi:hypothetical protein [Rhizobium phage RHph_X2_24]|nr:hypothetical protein [Rhizobium phage RHph_X2_24]
MQQTATLTVWSGTGWTQVTGKVVKIYPKGMTIDTDQDVRWYASTDRAVLHTVSGQDIGSNSLW